MKDYCTILKNQRELTGLNQVELAKAIGTSQQNINRWENGQVIPGINFCIKLAEFYGISLDELVGISDIPQKQSAASLPAKLDRKSVV